MRLLFLGFAVPERVMEDASQRDRNQPQIAAHKLQWNIINGLEVSLGHPVDLASAVAVSDYPAFPQIVFPYVRFSHTAGARDVLLPYLNIILLRHVTRLFSSLAFTFAWLRRQDRNARRVILVYAMHSPFVVTALMMSRLFGAKAAIIIPDLANYTEFGIRRGRVRRAAKPLDNWLQTALIAQFDGLIVLTEYMAQRLAPGRPALVVEGVVSDTRGRDEATSNLPAPANHGKVILYTGALAKEFGVQLLIEAFSQIPDSDYRLWICGKGVLADEVRAASKRDPRIEYLGFVSEDELARRTAEATVLAQLRLSNVEYVPYSFPSKLLEYMKSGRPVVSTILAGVPDEYYEHLYVLEEESPDALARVLHDICSQPPAVLAAKGRQAREFVTREKNYVRQGRRIYEFLASL